MAYKDAVFVALRAGAMGFLEYMLTNHLESLTRDVMDITYIMRFAGSILYLKIEFLKAPYLTARS